MFTLLDSAKGIVAVCETFSAAYNRAVARYGDAFYDTTPAIDGCTPLYADATTDRIMATIQRS